MVWAKSHTNFHCREAALHQVLVLARDDADPRLPVNSTEIVDLLTLLFVPLRRSLAAVEYAEAGE